MNQAQETHEKLESQEYRKAIIDELKGQENQTRLENSQEEWDVYSGNIKPYVEQRITDRFNAKLVKEVPIVSAINILKKVVDSRGSLYKQEPERTFTDLSEQQNEAVKKIYNDMRVDFSMLEANKLYELQKKQTHVLIEPKRGRLTMRPVKAHQLNVVPSEQDPELGEVFIFSGYNKELNENRADLENQNFQNEKIADVDDGKAEEDRFIWWSKAFHFVTDGNGLIISEEYISPLIKEGVIPVVEIAAMKDFTYWREQTNDVAEFCVDYNMHQSMLGQIVELQGFAQAYLKAPEDLMPQYVEIGPNRILKLVTNPNQEGEVEFGYATPNSDIASAQAYNEALLAQFLSSQGIDSSSVSGQAQATKYNSGVERLLAQIEKFEASKETMAIFRDAEADVYRVVKAWHNSLLGTEVLNPKYTTTKLPEESEVNVKYGEPQTLLNETDKLDIAERRVDLGVWSKEQALAYLDEVEVDDVELPENEEVESAITEEE